MVRISDEEIIRLLRKNARMPYTEMAKIFNVSETAVRKRVRKLEGKGVIQKYTIEVDPKKIGYSANALIGIDTKPEHLIPVLEKLKKDRGICALYSTSGDHMIIAECWFADTKELTGYIKKLKAIKGITKICPAIIMEKIK